MDKGIPQTSHTDRRGRGEEVYVPHRHQWSSAGNSDWTDPFILYINDLIEVLKHSKGLSFADDTKLVKAISGMQSVSQLQEDLWLLASYTMVASQQHAAP